MSEFPFHAIVLASMPDAAPKRSRRNGNLLRFGMLLTVLVVPLRASPVVMDNAPEAATFAVIGGALCLAGLRLRRRKD